MESKEDKNIAGAQISISYDKLKKSKEREEKANTRRSIDGTWAVNREKSYFGFKLQTIVRSKDSICAQQ